MICVSSNNVRHPYLYLCHRMYSGVTVRAAQQMATVLCNGEAVCYVIQMELVNIDKIEKNEMGGACSSDGEGRDLYKVLVWKT
jgi:hypothetical protein